MLFAVSTSSSPIVATRSSWAKSPVLAGRLTGDERSEAAAEGIQFVLQVIGGDGDRSTVSFRPLVLGQVEVGPHIHLDGDDELAGEVL